MYNLDGLDAVRIHFEQHAQAKEAASALRKIGVKCTASKQETGGGFLHISDSSSKFAEYFLTGAESLA